MKQDIQPIVTVYIPTHNRRKLLERALMSVINQTYSNIEIIVVNDGSTDDTDIFMKNLSDKNSNIVYLKYDKSKGANAARNLAIKEANGFFITGLDDDDEMFPERIEKMVEAYDDTFAYVFAGYTMFQENKRKQYIPKKEIITLDDMLYKNVTGNQILSTKKMFFDAGLFDEELVAAQDYDMWIRMLKIKPSAKVIQEPLSYIYNLGHLGITNSKKRMTGYLQCYNKHKNIMTYEQKKARIVEMRHIKRKKVFSKRMILLYPIQKWPRVYIGYYKRKLMRYLMDIKYPIKERGKQV